MTFLLDAQCTDNVYEGSFSAGRDRQQPAIICLSRLTKIDPQQPFINGWKRRPGS